MSDYTYHVARGLAAAGDLVQVWAPACAGPDPTDAGVRVRRIPGHFGPYSLLHLSRNFPGSTRVLVQYVPHAFGWKAMNVPFCIWLWSKRRQPIWVMFHEVAFPMRRDQKARHNLLGLVNRSMSWLALKSAERVWVSIPAWEQLLRRLSRELPPVGWLPIPSGIPVVEDPGGIASVKARFAESDEILIGHFGTYATDLAVLLGDQVLAILGRFPKSKILLMGRGSDTFLQKLTKLNWAFAGRLYATGAQSAADLSRHLSACDLMVQPDPNGVSSRRTSITAALAHGRPVLTTSGPLTEAFWHSSPGVILTPIGDSVGLLDRLGELVADRGKRERLSGECLSLYRSRFDVAHTIAALRSAA